MVGLSNQATLNVSLSLYLMKNIRPYLLTGSTQTDSLNYTDEVYCGVNVGPVTCEVFLEGVNMINKASSAPSYFEPAKVIVL